MMKYLIYLVVYLTVFLTKVQCAYGYIPNLDFILNKTTSTTGRQILAIEQDVTFKIDTEEAVIQENWLIEGDKNLKLTARGQGLFKENLNLHYLYNAKNKTSVVAKNKITTPLTTDFFQKLLFIRSADAFKNHMKELSITNQVRLSRADGRTAFALGDPSGAKLTPQIWIDQDEFVIRKIRLPSETEIELSDISAISNDLYIAKTQVISWNNLQIKIKVKSVSTKTGATLSNFYPQNLDTPSEISFTNKSVLTEAIDQFYKRFR
jgi:hypothetical protein